MVTERENLAPNVLDVAGDRPWIEVFSPFTEAEIGRVPETRDTSSGVHVASRLEAGTVGVNDGYAAAWSSYDAPMGGMKTSGLDRRHASEGLLKYTEPQTVAVQRIGPAFAHPPGSTIRRIRGSSGRCSRF